MPQNLSYNIDSTEAIFYNGITDVLIYYYLEENNTINRYDAFCVNYNFNVQEIEGLYGYQYELSVEVFPPCIEHVKNNIDNLTKVEIVLYSGDRPSITIKINHSTYNNHLSIEELIVRIIIVVLFERESDNIEVNITLFDFRPPENIIESKKKLYKTHNLCNNLIKISDNRKEINIWDKEVLTNETTFSYADIFNNNRRDIKYVGYQDRIFTMNGKLMSIQRGETISDYESFVPSYKSNRYNILTNKGILYGYTNRSLGIALISSDIAYINNIPQDIDTDKIFLIRKQYHGKDIHLAPCVIHNRDGTDYPNMMLYNILRDSKDFMIINSTFNDNHPKQYNYFESIRTPTGASIPTGKIEMFDFITPFMNYVVYQVGTKVFLDILYYKLNLDYNHYDFENIVPYSRYKHTFEITSIKNIYIFGLDYNKIIMIQGNLYPPYNYFVIVFNEKTNSFYIEENSSDIMIHMGGGGGYSVRSIASLKGDGYGKDDTSLRIVISKTEIYINTWYKEIDRQYRYRLMKL